MNALTLEMNRFVSNILGAAAKQAKAVPIMDIISKVPKRGRFSLHGFPGFGTVIERRNGYAKYYWELSQPAMIPMHFHPSGVETITLTEGSARMAIGDKSVELTRGRTLRIPHGTPHALQPTSHTVRYILEMIKE